MSQRVTEEGLSVLQGEMSRAQMVILHGHQMAANHHYALALIVQRCNELRHHCDVITNAIRTKRASLTRARDLLLRLEGVTELFVNYKPQNSRESLKRPVCEIYTLLSICFIRHAFWS